MNDLNICLVQVNLAWEDPDANRQKIATMLKDEVGKHDLIILPEMYTTGFTMQPKDVAEPNGGKESGMWMQLLSRQLGAVILGSVVVEEAGKYYNRVLVVNGEGIVMKYDKRHLFRMAGEHKRYLAG
ncbi:MAG: nitrilase-related carbon-nitrogen hydrolase, partial [Bacteroidota bacterium]